jgi:hypothetical protein
MWDESVHVAPPPPIIPPPQSSSALASLGGELAGPGLDLAWLEGELFGRQDPFTALQLLGAGNGASGFPREQLLQGGASAPEVCSTQAAAAGSEQAAMCTWRKGAMADVACLHVCLAPVHEHTRACFPGYPAMAAVVARLACVPGWLPSCA